MWRINQNLGFLCKNKVKFTLSFGFVEHLQFCDGKVESDQYGKSNVEVATEKLQCSMSSVADFVRPIIFQTTELIVVKL